MACFFSSTFCFSVLKRFKDLICPICNRGEELGLICLGDSLTHPMLITVLFSFDLRITKSLK